MLNMPRIITYLPTKSPKRRPRPDRVSLLEHLTSRVVRNGRLATREPGEASKPTPVKEPDTAALGAATASVWGRLVEAVKRSPR